VSIKIIIAGGGAFFQRHREPVHSRARARGYRLAPLAAAHARVCTRVSFSPRDRSPEPLLIDSPLFPDISGKHERTAFTRTDRHAMKGTERQKERKKYIYKVLKLSGY